MKIVFAESLLYDYFFNLDNLVADYSTSNLSVRDATARIEAMRDEYMFFRLIEEHLRLKWFDKYVDLNLAKRRLYNEVFNFLTQHEIRYMHQIDNNICTLLKLQVLK